jgi:hypothetical protein
VIHPGEIEAAVEQHLKTWSAYAAARLADEDGGPPLPDVRSWDRGVDFDWRPQEALPLVIVSVQQTADPQRHTDGWRVRLAINVSVTTEDKTQTMSADQAKRLITAYTQIVMARPSASGLDDLTWLGADYVPLDDRRGRRVSAAETTFNGHVDLPGPWSLPATPPDPYEPPAALREVTATRVNVDPRLP